MKEHEINELTKMHLIKHLKTLRKEYSESPIHVGDQLVSTQRKEDGEWLARQLNAMQAPPESQYPYTPDGGLPTVLTRDQVLRIVGCRTWYVNQCFAVEAYYAGRVEKGMKFTQLITQLEETSNPLLRWPQTQFDWVHKG